MYNAIYSLQVNVHQSFSSTECTRIVINLSMTVHFAIVYFSDIFRGFIFRVRENRVRLPHCEHQYYISFRTLVLLLALLSNKKIKTAIKTFIRNNNLIFTKIELIMCKIADNEQNCATLIPRRNGAHHVKWNISTTFSSSHEKKNGQLKA